jgi:hypothetical protein
MDLNRLTRTEQLICGSAILLFVASLMPWFRVTFLGASVVRTGWQTGVLWCGLPVLLGLAMLAHLVITRFEVRVQVPDLPWARVHLVCGVLAGALVVLKLLVGHQESSVEFHRALGMLLAAMAGIGLALGGWRYFSEHGGASM